MPPLIGGNLDFSCKMHKCNLILRSAEIANSVFLVAIRFPKKTTQYCVFLVNFIFQEINDIFSILLLVLYLIKLYVILANHMKITMLK